MFYYLKLNFFIFVFLLSFLNPGFVFSSEKSQYLEKLYTQSQNLGLSQSAQWLKLLHYRKNLFGGYKSQADGVPFFLAEDGKANPESELKANLKAFFSTDTELKEWMYQNWGSFLDSSPKTEEEKQKLREFLSQHPQCRFPARFAWLKEKLGFQKKFVPVINCPKYDTFKNRIAAKSATVVFSSYYLNNPASGFGHTLLRLNKTPENYAGPRYELLDYGISYAATLTVSNPIVYAIYGVFGMFPGSLTSVPYYYKVREYNDYESRDLWEYDLSLNEKQVALLVAHLWELGSTYFDYYYLSENCSYHVLTLLEAGNPELNLVDKLPSVVIPADTVRVLADTPNLVSNIRYRPSIRILFQERLKHLSKEQTDELENLISSFKKPDITFSITDVNVLDTAIDYLDFTYQKDLTENNSKASLLKQKLLSYRSRLSTPTQEIRILPKEDEMPHRGHESGKVALDYGYSQDQSQFTRLHFRLALHDLLDSRIGYPPYAQIEFLSTKLRFNFDRKKEEEKRLWLEDLSFLRVVSLSDWSRFSKQMSWNVKVGAKTLRDQSCNHCLSGDFGVGAGVTFRLLDKIQLISMLDSELNLTPAIHPFFARIGLGPTETLRFLWTNRFTTLINASYRIRFPSNETHYFEAGLETRYALSKSLAINAKWAKYPDLKKFPWELSGGLQYYF